MGAPIGIFDRVVGRLAESTGPVVVSIGGLHGNEPAGVVASRRVIEKIETFGVPFRGEFVALAGNLAALGLRRRYIDEDLNRIWLPERLGPHPAVAGSQESVEQHCLMKEIRRATVRSPEETYFVDLHTTSAEGAPFSVFADTLRNRHLARALPAPMVLGLEEHLKGTLLNYINGLGYAAVGFEGGQHESLAAIEAHELAIWRTLQVAGCVRAADIPDLDRLTRDVEARTQSLPSVVDVHYRHPIQPEHEFAMIPGFTNFKRVEIGTLLARDRNGEIRATQPGRILMPLYQSQGEDGFFIVRDVRRLWLTLSVWMRWLGLDRLLPYMPGVQQKIGSDDTFLVNPAVARWLVVEIFHLLGFRRKSPEAGKFVFSRRRELPSNRIGGFGAKDGN